MTARTRPLRRRYAAALDVAGALLLTGLDLGLTAAWGGSWWPARPGTLAWVMLGLQTAACMSLVVRRRFPIAVLAALGGFTLAVTLLISPLGLITPEHSGNLWAPLSTSLAAYGTLFYPSGREPCAQNMRLRIAALALFTAIIARVWEPSATTVTIGVLRTALGPLLALDLDARRRLVKVLVERAERAEREQHLLAEQARVEERARLAGEMHDVVTHRLSLMVLQAGALRLTAADASTRQVAEELRAAGCQALDELRDLVEILHSTPDGDQSPSVADLSALAAESAGVGIRTELVERGDPADASPVIGRTIYRIVREALTNVRKHAPGAEVSIQIEYTDSQVRISVRNTAPTAEPDALAGTGSGLGIAQLRRRVELVSGSLRAGSAENGGFCVEAVLPSYVPTREAV